jgi:folate-binding protein YgfZ
MTSLDLYRIERLCVVDVGGKDADKILHNLTTNEVKSLPDGRGRETFVTDVRGKTLAHVDLYRLGGSMRMIGPHGPSEALVAHIDRYTIREDATPTARDDEWVAMVAGPDADGLHPLLGSDGEPPPSLPSDPLPCGEWHGYGFDGTIFQTRWLGAGTRVLLIARDTADAFAKAIADTGAQIADEAAFHQTRTRAGYPWFGIDLNDSNLPQEADRDSVAISFTKGCYLGQETVARLDALGQVQKKLVRWQIVGATPPAGTEVTAGEKVVGRLTSIAPTEAGAVAIGMARRSHFDAGSVAGGVVASTGESFTATVL